jgi:cytidylate kinase
MAPIVIVTGAPGTGKTTVARRLAHARPRGLHLPADPFFEFPAHPISPYRPEAREQNVDLMIVLARTAAAFASRGYDVFLEGIFGPWFLPVLARELQSSGRPVDYVVLRAPLDTVVGRVRAREGSSRERVVRQMHAAFADLGEYAGHAVDTGEATPEEVVAAVWRGQADGVFTLDTARLAAGGAA